MACGEEVVGERETRPLGHGSMNRERQVREREEVKAILPRPRMRPEDTVDAVVAMAGGESSPAHSKMAILATIFHGKRSGRERRA